MSDVRKKRIFYLTFLTSIPLIGSDFQFDFISSIPMTFPDNFTWGIASAAYQIEGAALEDGRGLSVWDVFCRQPGRSFEGQNGDLACDHYHRYKEDIALWKTIGPQAYRFSVSWPRVLPEGIGKINQKGLDFYDSLVDELLRNGIDPWITLFHWDFPYELMNRGGWLNRDSADWFGDYAGVICSKLSDRVSHWITFNEPTAFVSGHGGNLHAPGLQLGMHDLARIHHHVLLAHGKAVQTIRSLAETAPQLGMAPCNYPGLPVSNSPEDIEAARQYIFGPNAAAFNSTSAYYDCVFLGRFPEGWDSFVGEHAARISDEDWKIITESIDFTGLNNYYGHYVRMGEDGKPQELPPNPQRNLTAQNFRGIAWEYTPETMYWGPKFFFERYGKPIYIFENGMCNRDWVSQDGKVHDPQRIEFLSQYMKQLEVAIDDGVDIRGYFHWGVMDDFEWPNGYTQRFGLIYVDFETQQRILKDSAYFYKDVIASNGASLKAKE